MKTDVQKISTMGWDSCYVLRSGPVEVIATANIGPRIMFFGLTGGKILCKLFDGQVGRSGD